MRETLAGIRVIRAFVQTHHEERRFDEANQDLSATALRVNRLFALMFPTIMRDLQPVVGRGPVVRGDAGRHGALPIGNLMAFLQYLMQILFSVLMAVIMFVMVPRAAASAERIQEVLDTEISLADPEAPSAWTDRPVPPAVGSPPAT